MSNRHLLCRRNAPTPSGAAQSFRHRSHSARDAEVFERRRARLPQARMRLLPQVRPVPGTRPLAAA